MLIYTLQSFDFDPSKKVFLENTYVHILTFAILLCIGTIMSILNNILFDCVLDLLCPGSDMCSSLD